MNCQDIALILDDGDVVRLDHGLRRKVQAHLDFCPGCADEWNLHARLVARRLPRLPAGMMAGCRALSATAGRSEARQGVRRRFYLGGALAAAAAAALLVVLWPRQTALESPGEGLRPQGNAPLSAVTVSASSDEQAGEAGPESVLKPDPAGQVTVRVVRMPEPNEAGSGDLPIPATAALLEEAKAIRDDPVNRRALDALGAALEDQLRALPGITVVGPGTLVDVADTSSRHYQLRIGSLMSLSSDGKLARPESRYVDVSLTAEQLQPDSEAVRRMSAGYRIDLQAACAGTATAGSPPCADPAGTAATFVARLREQVLPPDPSVPRQLQAQLQDSSLQAAQRLKALTDMIALQSRMLDSTLLRDHATVRGAIDLASSADAAQRALVWRAMRGSGHPDLIAPLLTSTMQEADEVRLQAVATLAADFAGDPQVRAALEVVARDDPRPLIRALAERGLSGDEVWRGYVTASLSDTGRPAAERLEAFIYHVHPPGVTANSYGYEPGAFHDLDDRGIRTLAQLLPTAGNMRGGEGQIGSLISELGYRYSKNPAVTDTLLHYLVHGTQTRTRRIAGEVLARTHGSDPRVREALNKTIASDPDASVRDYVREIMGPVAPAPAPAAQQQ